jgi:hypothetical protein
LNKWLVNNGILIITTQYNGYFKNLMIALLNKSDTHFNPLWEGGHIKFFSKNTLEKLIYRNGFKLENFYGAGRIPYLWKSMILVCKKM